MENWIKVLYANLNTVAQITNPDWHFAHKLAIGNEGKRVIFALLINVRFL